MSKKDSADSVLDEQIIVDRSPELLRGANASVMPEGSPRFPQAAEDLMEVSVRGNGKACVLAQAVRRLFPGTEPHIEGEYPYLILADGRKRKIVLSPDLVAEIGKYDRGEPDAFANLDIIVVTTEAILLGGACT